MEAAYSKPVKAAKTTKVQSPPSHLSTPTRRKVTKSMKAIINSVAQERAEEGQVKQAPVNGEEAKEEVKRDPAERREPFDMRPWRADMQLAPATLKPDISDITEWGQIPETNNFQLNEFPETDFHEPEYYQRTPQEIRNAILEGNVGYNLPEFLIYMTELRSLT